MTNQADPEAEARGCLEAGRRLRAAVERLGLDDAVTGVVELPGKAATADPEPPDTALLDRVRPNFMRPT